MEIPRDVIDQIIQCSLNSEDFDFICYENSNTNDLSIGFLSSQDKKCIKYKTRGKEADIFIFIKQLPQKQCQKSMTVELGSFQRESLLYHILANFDDYQLPIPKCYLVDSVGLIVLEDLSRKGYRNKDLYQPLDIEECRKVLDSLSKFHAASFIIEKREGHKLNVLYPELENEVLLNPSDNNCGKRCCLVGIKALKTVSAKYMSHYPKEVVNEAFTYMEHIFENLKSSNRYANALSHMDLWLNNIMFKYDDNGQLHDTRFIDFQFVTYKPPAYDVQFFLHTCTIKELRDNDYDHLLRYYFDSLSNQLAQSNISLDGIMTWNDFKNTVDETLPLVLATAAIYLKFVLMPPDIVKDVLENDETYNKYVYEDRSHYVLQAILKNKHYKLRIFDCLTELFDYFKLRHRSVSC